VSCPACGQDLRPGARFCDGCGAAVEARCPACGKGQRPQARFCDACGTPFGAAASSTLTTAAPAVARPPAAYTPRHLAERILTEGRALRGERKK
jgi:predicted amidophosphoribosyltransferase